MRLSMKRAPRDMQTEISHSNLISEQLPEKVNHIAHACLKLAQYLTLKLEFKLSFFSYCCIKILYVCPLTAPLMHFDFMKVRKALCLHAFALTYICIHAFSISSFFRKFLHFFVEVLRGVISRAIYWGSILF